MKKAFKNRSLKAFVLSNGRCERIRTFDPLHPMQVRYQAAPHTDSASDCTLRLTVFSVRCGQQITYFKQLSAHQDELVDTVKVEIIALFVALAVFKIGQL